MSVLDMIISFVNFVGKYCTVEFTRPVFNSAEDKGRMSVRGMKSVWTN